MDIYRRLSARETTKSIALVGIYAAQVAALRSTATKFSGSSSARERIQARRAHAGAEKLSRACFGLVHGDGLQALGPKT